MISSQGLLDTTMIRFVHTLTYPQPKSNFRIAILNRYNQTQPSYLNDHYLNANIAITLIWNNVLISKKLDFLRSRKFSEIFFSNKCKLSGATGFQCLPIRGRFYSIKLKTRIKNVFRILSKKWADKNSSTNSSNFLKILTRTTSKWQPRNRLLHRPIRVQDHLLDHRHLHRSHQENENDFL